MFLLNRLNFFNITVLTVLILPCIANAQDLHAEVEQCDSPGARENLQRADLFLAENHNREGVIATESGLQYKVLKAGSGTKHPRGRDTVSTHYTLTNLNGDKLDSSHDRRMPLQFVVTEVIAGWQEALQLMTEGQQLQLFVPPHLGYRCKGSPPIIGPNELLIFDMELIAIVR